jgi:hypothetical protein
MEMIVSLLLARENDQSTYCAGAWGETAVADFRSGLDGCGAFNGFYAADGRLSSACENAHVAWRHHGA